MESAKVYKQLAMEEAKLNNVELGDKDGMLTLSATNN